MKKKEQKAWVACQNMIVHYLYGYSQALRKLEKYSEADVLENAYKTIQDCEVP